MRLSEILSEGVTGVVYHFTSAPSASDIISEKTFKLSSWQSHHAPKNDYKYFLSLARSKDSRIRRLKDTSVCLVLNGNWFNKRSDIISSPIEIDNFSIDNNKKKTYYDSDRGSARVNQMTMTEDRVWHNKDFLRFDNNLIKEVHILHNRNYLPPLVDVESKRLLKICQMNNMKWWYYSNEKTYAILNKVRAAGNYVDNPNDEV